MPYRCCRDRSAFPPSRTIRGAPPRQGCRLLTLTAMTVTIGVATCNARFRIVIAVVASLTGRRLRSDQRP